MTGPRFEVGDKVRLTGTLWGEPGSRGDFPKRGSIVTVSGISRGGEPQFFGADPSRGEHLIWGTMFGGELVEAVDETVKSTAEIKALLQDYAKAAGVDPARALRTFNRWFTQALAEERAEVLEEVPPQPRKGYVLFQGPHEVYLDYDEMDRRAQSLAEVGIYVTATVTQIEDDGEILGLTVQPPQWDEARATSLTGF